MFHLDRQHASLKDAVLEKWEALLDRSEFTFGRDTLEFEQSFAKLCDVQYAVGVRSGTASLIIALKAVGIGPGDEVITTPATFSATADAISLVGATPVFADIESKYGCIDPAEIDKKITRKTKAVLVVHLYGIPCQMDEISKICTDHNLFLIEDASHAHGSMYKTRPAGSLGDVACFSLYPSKTLGCVGNAGVITTHNLQLAERARMFAHHGIIEGRSKYEHHVAAFNELIDNLQAAVLNIKMPLLQSWIARKIDIAEQYNRALAKAGHPGMKWPSDANPSLYVYAIQINNREKFQKHMSDHSIDTGVYYPTPLHLQPSYTYLGHIVGDFPSAEQWMRKTVSVPLYPELSDSEVERICTVLSTFV